MRLIPLALLGLFAVATIVPAASAASPRGRDAAAKVVKPASRAAAPAASRAAVVPRLVSRAAAAPVLRSGPTVRGRAAVTVSPGPRSAAAAPRGRQTAKASGRGIRQQPQVARGSIRGGAYEEVAEAPARFTGRGARYTSWQSGLPAASGEQRDCPAGTMSTLARGHDDVVRCMPL